MCDYSLQHVRSRPARVDDKLTTRDFGTFTRGFAAAEDAGVAVCVLPGTELAFSSAVTSYTSPLSRRVKVETLGHATAIFRQVNKDEPFKHHDALEFPDGRIVLLTKLSEGQEATVCAACAASERGRGKCPDAHCLCGLKVRDRRSMCRLPCLQSSLLTSVGSARMSALWRWSQPVDATLYLKRKRWSVW